MIVLALEQAERLLGTELRDSGEILHAKSVENLNPAEFARTTAQRAFNFL
jgi:hypothetical protein